jgi:hypothetical protein
LGAKYFLIIVDDYSRFTWVFFMHHKHETQNLLTIFFSFVKTQFNASIANIRIDNGGEFFSIKWHNLSTLLHLYTSIKWSCRS